jgi:hypothetical protein
MDSGHQEEAFHMVPADIHRAVDIRAVGIQAAAVQAAGIQAAAVQAAGIQAAAVHNLVVGCYKDPLVEVVMGERSHHTDLADLGLDPD